VKLPHTVTILRSTVTVDRKGVVQESWASPTSRERAAWVQPRGSSEVFEPESTRVRSTHVMFCLEPDVASSDRVLHAGDTYLVVGNPARHETPAGYHHTEADLLIVEG